MDWAEYLFVILVLIIMFIGSSQRFSMRKGKFTIAKSSKEFLSFSSDFGSFHIKFNEKSVYANNLDNKKTISLEDIAGIRYVVNDELALHTERFSLKSSADLNNVIHWYIIKLILKDRTDVPVFIAGEYEPKSWFGEWQSRLEINTYQMLGLVKEVEGHSRDVLETILTSFKVAGNELQLM